LVQEPFNPLDKLQLGESIARELLSRDAASLEALTAGPQFPGAGVYAIYYRGEFPPYRLLLSADAVGRRPPPIYVGKAIPPGGRTGRLLPPEAVKSPALHGRLSIHARSITDAVNLDLGDFSCRYLILDDIWIPLGETILIEAYQPLWNTKVSGFGNNATGGPRSRQKRSSWDTIHPGRPWAAALTPNKRSADEIIAMLMSNVAIPEDPDAVQEVVDE